MTEEFQLTDGERHHPLWTRMRLHLMGELDIARIHIGRGVDKSEQWTAMMRGRIKCLEGIIALGDDRPVTGK